MRIIRTEEPSWDEKAGKAAPGTTPTEVWTRFYLQHGKHESEFATVTRSAHYGGVWQVDVNWSSCGSVDVAFARDFAAMLAQANMEADRLQAELDAFQKAQVQS